MLGEDVGAAFAAIHTANGVELRSHDQIVGFEGTEHVEAAVTANHGRVACDFAVVGIGIEPEIPMFTGEPVAQSNGVLVDESCRASLPDVYAAGDVANHLHPVFGRVRVEHYNNGEQMGRAAARSMLTWSVERAAARPRSFRRCCSAPRERDRRLDAGGFDVAGGVDVGQRAARFIHERSNWTARPALR